MKALSLWQPFASLVALGAKPIETRGWATSFRGPLAIHATLMTTSALVATYETEPCDCGGTGHTMLTTPAAVRATAVAKLGYWPMCGKNSEPSKGAQRLPFGAVVAVCRVVDCIPIVVANDPYEVDAEFCMVRSLDGERLYHKVGNTTADMTDQLPFGDFSHGRYAWMLQGMTQLAEPIPARGRQGLWNWPNGDSVMAALVRS